ncbi:taurine dioxygenase [Azotobacter beijerinckii]|uniref:Taurine dioxygenase n=1 Tax=Azotobacter beijerinckii TaxID=170623 RepID=A0A1H6R1C8_9GAMM|nr:TauD/TfdA family dioxygenase [Azotobacter beijerinckii]SEI46093.1 taurine dioxygenase [Azotobacter beijerinckii]SEI46267.1 taurine dioxygenase [Azotobacter beijerinckii]SEP68425.1 taurine dioxygenase [Azotobacter beijerinckii]
MPLDIRPVTGRIGAIVSGVRLTDLSDAQFAELQQALLRHKALFLRDQHLSDAEQEAFGRRFGDLVVHPTVHTAENTAGIFDVDSERSRANSWHTDITFVADYPKVTILRGEVIPEAGGDTVFANTVSAYQDLPEPLRVLADSLWTLHTNVYDYAAPKQIEAVANKRFREEFTATRYETEHPLVRVHPETGEKALVLGHFVQKILGLNSRDSHALLEIFQAHIVRLENTVRWRWSKGDVALWDNRATQHIAVDDYGSARRIVRRTTVLGEIPVSVGGETSRAIKPSPETRIPRSEADKLALKKAG